MEKDVTIVDTVKEMAGGVVNAKKIVLGVVLVFVSFLLLLCWFTCATSIRLVKDQQTIERLRDELEDARTNELVLEQRIVSAERTINDGRERVERLTKLTGEAKEQFTRGQSTINGLRESIKEAEEFYTNLENELNSLRSQLGNDDSNLEM